MNAGICWPPTYQVFSLAGIILLSTSCVKFRMSSKEINRYFDTRNLAAEEYTYRIGNRTINYVHVGDEKLPLVIFVHGSPGSLSAFIHFLSDSTLLSKAQLVAVDRPGFGASNFGEAEPSLERQALLLKPILEKYGSAGSTTLVGHSLGGPVIARMAIEYPELVNGLIMVAPSIDPDLEPNEWFRGPLATPFLKWLLPRSFRASNDEIWNLKPELQLMQRMWSSIKTPTIVIQGTEDKLVPLGNAYYAEKMLVNAPVELVIIEGMDHFVPWSHPVLIHDAIDKLNTPPTPSLSSN